MLKIFTDNAHYIVCLRNKRNALKIRALATQTKPCNASFVLNAYLDATKPKPTIKDSENQSNFGYGYLIFDFNVTGTKYYMKIAYDYSFYLLRFHLQLQKSYHSAAICFPMKKLQLCVILKRKHKELQTCGK